MTKVHSQYPTLDGGVTQRPLRAQRANQLLAMENMWWDPVMGLTRRPGCELVGADSIAAAEDTGDVYRRHTVEEDDERYSVVYPVAGPYSADARVFFVNHDTLSTTTPISKPGDAVWLSAMTNGFGSVTNVGDLVVATVNGLTPTYTTNRPWATPNNQRQLVVWCRGGAYSRTFTVKFLRGNKRLIISYTTMAATYPNVLDTSDILPTDPDYSKKVNDRTNVYNSQVNAWISEALADITPENIVAKLASTLLDSGFLSPGASVLTDGPYLLITDPQMEEIEGDDGGDGNLLRAVGSTVGAPELLTVNGYPGKIVKVRPGQSERGEVFYLQAVAKDKSTGKYTPVTWEECAGEVFTTDPGMVYMVLHNGLSYASSDLEWLSAQTGRTFAGWATNISGDEISNPPAPFHGKAISALTVFQDRLLAFLPGGAVAASQPGDYFNFYRDSAITVLDTDPVTFSIIGGEGDTVRHCLAYDRNLLMVGDERQYLINGRQPMVAGQSAAAVFAKVPGMQGTRPAVVEGDLFFTRFHNGCGSMHCLRPGRVAEDPYVAEITEHVNTYVEDEPLEIVACKTPDAVFVRTASNRLYVANYRHTEGQQAYAVHRWEVNLGAPVLMVAEHRGELHILSRHYTGVMNIHRIRFQRAAPGQPLRHFDQQADDSVGGFTSTVELVSARLSPEAGNVTGMGYGAGFDTSKQRHTVNSVHVFFADTAAARVTSVYKAGRPPRSTYYEVQ